MKRLFAWFTVFAMIATLGITSFAAEVENTEAEAEAEVTAAEIEAEPEAEGAAETTPIVTNPDTGSNGMAVVYMGLIGAGAAALVLGRKEALDC